MNKLWFYTSVKTESISIPWNWNLNSYSMNMNRWRVFVLRMNWQETDICSDEHNDKIPRTLWVKTAIKFQRHTLCTGNFESFVLTTAFYFVKRRAIFLSHQYCHQKYFQWHYRLVEPHILVINFTSVFSEYEFRMKFHSFNFQLGKNKIPMLSNKISWNDGGNIGVI